MDQQLKFLKLIAGRLGAARIPYMLTGSIALSYYTTPRMTRDIDLVVQIGLDDVGTIIDLFSDDCYLDRGMVRDAVLRIGMFNIIHNTWIVKADLIVRKSDPFRILEFQRRRSIDIEGMTVFIVTPEDLLLSKLCWAQTGVSDLQLGDARDLIRDIPDLDWDYLKHWAGELGVAVELESLRSPE